MWACKIVCNRHVAQLAWSFLERVYVTRCSTLLYTSDSKGNFEVSTTSLAGHDSIIMWYQFLTSA